MPLPWLDRASAMRWPALALVFVAALGLTVIIAHSGPAVRVQADDHPPEHFQETIIEAKPPPIDPDQPTITPPPCNCWNKALAEQPSYFLTAFGGASYFDSTPDTSAGGMYGVNLWKPIYGPLGAMGRAQMNNYSGASQYGASFGLYKTAIPAGGLGPRLGASILIDQFTDTTFGNPWLVQGQYAATYALSDHIRLGGRYIDPLHSDDIKNSVIIPGAPGSSPFSLTDVVEANITLGASPVDSVQFGVGYIDAFETMTYRLTASKPINDRLGATFNTSYDEKIGRWSGFLGFQVDLSPKRLNDLRIASRGVPSSEEIVRGAGVGSAASFLASVAVFPSLQGSYNFWSAPATTQNYPPMPMDSLDYTNSINRGFEFSYSTGSAPANPCPNTTCPSGMHPDPNQGCACVFNNN